MAVRFIKTCITAFWALLIIILLAIAIYVSLGRLFAPLIAKYHELLETRLEEVIKADIELEGVRGTWVHFRPGIEIDTLKLEVPETDLPHDESDPDLLVGKAIAELDVWGSLKKRTWVFTGLSFSDANITLVENEDGSWRVKGLPRQKKSNSNWKKIVNRMLVQHDLRLNNVQLTLEGLNEQRSVTLESFNLDNRGLHHYLQASLSLHHKDYQQSKQKTESIELVLTAEGRKVEQLKVKGFLYLPNIDWHEWSFITKPQPKFAVSRLTGGGKFWFNVKGLSLQNINGSLNVDQVAIDHFDLNQHRLTQQNLRDLSFQFHLNRIDKKHVTAQINQFQFSYDELPLPPIQMDIDWQQNTETSTHQLTVKADQIEVQPFVRILSESHHLSPKLSDRIRTLNPSGVLSNPFAKVQWDPNQPILEGLNSYVESQVINASADASAGIPEVKGLNGKVVASHLGGVAMWDKQPLLFGMPKLFKESWSLTEAQGELHWSILPNQFKLFSSYLRGMSDGADVAGEFLLNIGRDQFTKDELFLSLGIQGGDISESQRYIPSQNLDAELNQWLESSIKAGELKSGALIFRGKVGKKLADQYVRLSTEAVKAETQSRVMQMNLSFENGHLDYFSPWPAVKNMTGSLWLDGADVEGQISDATLWNAKAENVAVVVKDGVVEVDGALSTEAGEVIRFFKETPLKEQMESVVGQWQATGSTSGTVKLVVPLNHPENLTVDVKAELNDGRLFMPEHALTFNQINGNFSYDTLTGFQAKDLATHLWRQPLIASISELNRDSHKASVVIKAQGSVDPVMASQWSQQPVINVVQGVPEVEASLTFFTHPEKPDHLENYLHLKTQLENASVDLPKPFDKKPSEKRPLEVRLTLEEPEKYLQASYGDNLRAVLALRPTGIHRGQVYLGKMKAVLPKSQGVSVLGSVSEVDYDDWMETFDRLVLAYEEYAQPGEETASIEETLKSIDIHTDNYTMFDVYLGNLEATVKRKEGYWDIRGQSNKIKGDVKLYDNVHVPMAVNVDYLYLPEEPEEQGGKSNVGSKTIKPIVVDPLQDVIASDLPSMNVVLKELFIGAESFGNWSFMLRPDEKGATLYDLVADVKAVQVNAEIRWDIIQGGKHLTQLSGSIEAKNMADVLSAWQLDPSLVSSDSRFDVDLSWFSSPLAMTLEQLIGDVSVDIKDGRFVESPNTGALKVFGILNFYSISRRLKLDFSDLYEKGLSYDEIKGRLKLNEGLISLADALIVKGPSGKFQVSGETNMLDESLDLEMAVTFPISSSLPFIAVIAGLTPQIAGTIFVTEKLIGNELERFTSASYDIAGTWDEPIMTINKRFNKDIEGSNNVQSLRARILSIFGIDVNDQDYEYDPEEDFENFDEFDEWYE